MQALPPARVLKPREMIQQNLDSDHGFLLALGTYQGQEIGSELVEVSVGPRRQGGRLRGTPVISQHFRDHDRIYVTQGSGQICHGEARSEPTFRLAAQVLEQALEPAGGDGADEPSER